MAMSTIAIAERAVTAYNESCRVPQLTGGVLTDKSCAVLEWKQRNPVIGEFENFQQTLFYSEATSEVISTTPSTPCYNSSFLSPSGQKNVIIRTSATEDKQQFLLYWKDNKLMHTVDLKALDLHQLIVEKPPSFQSCGWSVDERYFFYLAEQKTPPTRSFFSQKSQPAKEGATNVIPGQEYKYVEDWGEQLTGISRTQIGVFDTENLTARVLDFSDRHPEMKDKCVTKIIYAKSDKLIAIVHDTAPFRLGLIYCSQRRSQLVELTDNSDGLAVKYLSNNAEDLAVFDASVSPDGNHVLWFQCQAGGPHNRAVEAWKVELGKTEHRIQLTSVATIPLYFDGKGAFPRPCAWLENNRYVIIQDLNRGFSRIVAMNTENGQLVPITLPSERQHSSHGILSVRNNVILAFESGLTTPPKIWIGNIASWLSIAWKSFDPYPTVDAGLQQKIEWKILQTSFDSLECQVFISKPICSAQEKLPLVVVPHGGPHSAFTTVFNEMAISFALAGFATALINYPGSLSFSSLETLPGKIGHLDVGSVQHCAQLVSNEAFVDKSRVYMYGGSHGGFLALRLIAAFPDFYRAAACRNPVTNFAAMASVSDIPDWNFVECGLDPKLNSFPKLGDIGNAEVLAKMNEESPIRFIGSVKTPLLMALGSNDRRVPMSQGLAYTKALQQVHPTLPVEMFLYKDDHSLGSVKVHADCFVNVVNWFNKYSC